MEYRVVAPYWKQWVGKAPDGEPMAFEYQIVEVYSLASSLRSGWSQQTAKILFRKGGVGFWPVSVLRRGTV